MFIATLIPSNFLKYHRNLQFKEWIFTLPLLFLLDTSLCVCPLFFKDLYRVGWGLKNKLLLRFGAHVFVWKAEGWDSVPMAP